MREKLMVFFSCILLLTVGVSNAFASELTDNNASGTTQFEYEANTVGFSVSVPAVITVGNSAQNISISSGYMNLKPDQQVLVTISDGIDKDGNIVLNREKGNNAEARADILTTKLYINNEQVNVGTVIGEFHDQSTPTINNKPAMVLSAINGADSQTLAGTYKSSVTFKIQLL